MYVCMYVCVLFRWGDARVGGLFLVRFLLLGHGRTMHETWQDHTWNTLCIAPEIPVLHILFGDNSQFGAIKTLSPGVLFWIIQYNVCI